MAKAQSAPVVYAGFWRRFAAYIIDYFVIFLILVIALLPVGILVGPISINGTRIFDGLMNGNQLAEDISTIYAIVVVLLVYFGYFPYMESSEKQATFAKQWLGMRVTDTQGKRLSFLRALGRYFAKYLSHIILLLGYVMIGFTSKKQGLHDKIAGTYVVKVQK